MHILSVTDKFSDNCPTCVSVSARDESIDQTLAQTDDPSIAVHKSQIINRTSYHMRYAGQLGHLMGIFSCFVVVC